MIDTPLFSATIYLLRDTETLSRLDTKEMPTQKENALKVFAGLIALSSDWSDEDQKAFDNSELKEKIACSLDELAFAFNDLFYQMTQQQKRIKYELGISFHSSRELTEDELGKIQHDCIAQIEEPTKENGDDADFSTQLYGSDIDKVAN